MNLLFRPEPARDGVPVTQRTVSDQAVEDSATAKKAALETTLATKTAELTAACAAAERAELEQAGLGRAGDYSGEIEQLRQEITELEGRIEFYDQVLAAFE